MSEYNPESKVNVLKDMKKIGALYSMSANTIISSDIGMIANWNTKLLYGCILVSTHGPPIIGV